MVGRRRTTTAFRPSAPAGHRGEPSRLQTVAVLAGVVALAAAVALVSVLVKPNRARSFQLLYGSVLINDNTSPVSVDLASGKPTVRLTNAVAAVSAADSTQVEVVPLADGLTLMLDRVTGAFNVVDATGFLVKPTGGVDLPGSGAVTAVPAGPSAYLLQTARNGTSVYLVGKATVSAAANSGSRTPAKARAYATLGQPVAALPAPAASVNGELWALVGTDPSRRTLVQLSVPPGSNAGATLTRTTHGQLAGPAALESVAEADTGVLAVAGPDSVQLYDGDATHSLRVPIDGDVRQIYAASSAAGRAQFLYRTGSGWRVVTVAADGSGSASVHALAAIPARTELLAPAQSNGGLYTMSSGADRTLWRIDATGGTRALGRYPVRSGESASFSGTAVLARGPRVIYDARADNQAEVIFTDGSRAPLTIDKHAAVQLDAASANALAEGPARGHTSPGQHAVKTPVKPAPPAQQQSVNTSIDCRKTTATPNIPDLGAVTARSSRSATLRWTYPLIESGDCIPTSYQVELETVSPGAPAAPAPVQVQGTDSVTITGLFPATEYTATVVAYIRSAHTASNIVDFTTSTEGPAAPTDVRVTADSGGDWQVSWNSCGGLSDGCVPSAAWNVIPAFCDGRGFSAAPAPISIDGDPTVHSFSTTYPGSTATLGRGLCFRVQGVSPKDTSGTVSAAVGPVVSWSPPVAGALALTASQPATTALGASTTTSVDLALGSDPVRAVGGVGATITFTLTGPAGTQTRTTSFTGRSDHLSATFPGIQAGGRYLAEASVSPPGHPAAAVTTAPAPVSTRAEWPQLGADAQCPAGGGPIVLDCTLTVQLHGLSSAAAGGELFSLDPAASMLQCSSTGMQLTKTDFDPAQDVITAPVDLLSMTGTCTVRLVLLEGAGAHDPPVFGGTSSPPITTTVDVGQATTLDATSADFDAAWSAQGGSSVLVRYTGSRTDDQVGQITDPNSWTEQLFAPDGTACGTSSAQPTQAGIDLAVLPASCVNQYGDRTGWTTTVTYRDRGTGDPHSFTYPLTGTPPGYVPCQVGAGNFTATWASDPTVDVSFDAAGAQIGGCSGWIFVVQDASGTVCGQLSQPPGDLAIPLNSSCTPAAGYVVVIKYTDPAGNPPQPTFPQVTVGGTPPAPPPPPPSGSGSPPSDPPSPTSPSPASPPAPTTSAQGTTPAPTGG